MQTAKYLFNFFNYGFYCFYGFTAIDIIKKIVFNQFNLGNATNFFQLILTVIGVFFAYYKLRAYMRDSVTKSRILEEELKEKEFKNAHPKFYKEFIEPFENKEK